MIRRSLMVLGASSWLVAQTLAGPITGTPLNTTVALAIAGGYL